MAFGNQFSCQYKLAVQDRAKYINDFYSFEFNGVRYCVQTACGFAWEAYVAWPANHPDCNKSLMELNRIYPGIYNTITLTANGRAIGFTTATPHDYNLMRELKYGPQEGHKQYKSFDFVKQEIQKLAMKIKQRMDSYVESQRLNFNYPYPNMFMHMGRPMPVRNPNPYCELMNFLQELVGPVETCTCDCDYLDSLNEALDGYLKTTSTQRNTATTNANLMNRLNELFKDTETQPVKPVVQPTPAKMDFDNFLDSFKKNLEKMGFQVDVMPINVMPTEANEQPTSCYHHNSTAIPIPRDDVVDVNDNMPDLVSDSEYSSDSSSDSYSHDDLSETRPQFPHFNQLPVNIIDQSGNSYNSIQNPLYMNPDKIEDCANDCKTDDLAINVKNLDYDDIHSIEKMLPGLMQQIHKSLNGCDAGCKHEH